jgi:hypothetical protein
LAPLTDKVVDACEQSVVCDALISRESEDPMVTLTVFVLVQLLLVPVTV